MSSANNVDQIAVTSYLAYKIQLILIHLHDQFICAQDIRPFCHTATRDKTLLSDLHNFTTEDGYLSWNALPSCRPLTAGLEARSMGRVRVAVVLSNSDPNAVVSSYVLRFAPCLQHTPPLITRFVHPSLLHRLTFAPCLMHTPPF